MKFMKLGVHPDCFYTEEDSSRWVISDVPSDLTIRLSNITYHLHKYTLLPKCGLLQRLLGDGPVVELHDVPGGDDAFELCAKFCYGITINLSAHNFVLAFCASKFLGMTEAVETGNMLTKLEAFFSSCILQGWKDSVITLHATETVYELAENLGIVRRCIDSIVDKILTPPSKVTWSFTYTRPGYEKKRHPKDWWTEDLSLLGIDMFRSILKTLHSSKKVKPQLIGEALHVHACYWLLQSRSSSSPERKRRVLENIVSLIPPDKGSVSVKFLLRLLSVSNSIGVVSPATKAQLLRLCAVQLDEASLDDVLSCVKHQTYDVDLVKTVVKSFLRLWKKQGGGGDSRSVRTIRKVGMLIDLYLQVLAKDPDTKVSKWISLVEALPGIARPHHDHLYQAIDIYLKEHTELSKEDKKEVCRFLDCQKLSPQVRSHAVKNERLPLRTVVQALFFEQEKCSSGRDQEGTRLVAQSTSRRVHHDQLRAEPSFKVISELENGKEVKSDVVDHRKAQARKVHSKRT